MPGPKSPDTTTEWVNKRNFGEPTRNKPWFVQEGIINGEKYIQVVEVQDNGINKVIAPPFKKDYIEELPEDD